MHNRFDIPHAVHQNYIKGRYLYSKQKYNTSLVFFLLCIGLVELVELGELN